MIIFMINILQSLVPTSKILVQSEFCPSIQSTFHLDYSQGHQSDLYFMDVSANHDVNRA